MPDYPNKYPILPIVVPFVSHPKSSDRDLPNREIEAVCTELGTNPRSISDAVAPVQTPASVAAYLDMLANILKTTVNAVNWYSAAVPIRRFVGGSGNNATIAAATTNYAFLYGRGLSTTENLTYAVMDHRGVVKNLYLLLATAQPGTGSLVCTVRKNGADTGLILTIAAAAGAATYSSIGSVVYRPGDKLGLKILNNAPAAVSAQIGGFTMEYDQSG